MRTSRLSIHLGICACACFFLAACSTIPTGAPGNDEVVDAHRKWWNAYSVGNVAALDAATSNSAYGTFSSGATLTRQELLQAASLNGKDAGFSMAWSDEVVERPRPELALVVATSTEQAGPSLQRFRITTILERTPRGAWQVLGLQSTRIATASTRVPEAVSGPLAQFAGSYRTPRGRVLKLEAHGGVLALVEPDGKVIELAAIGPGLFESVGRSPINGLLRFAFSRDQAGRVTGFSRLTEGRVDTYPRSD